MTDCQQLTVPKRRRYRDQRVKRLRRKVVADQPALRAAKFCALVNSFAQITLLELDAYEFLREHGVAGPDGELRSSVIVVQRLISTQLELANALGLSPAALGDARAIGQ